MAHSTSETAFLTMEKSITYRGNREHWANSYHLDSVPTSNSVWQALANTVWALERAFLPADVKFEWFYGHTPGTPPVLVYEEDQDPAGEGGPPGTWVPGGAEHPTPGDSAGWIRYGTTQKNTLGKTIYLRNYYHGMYNWGDVDEIASNQVTPMNTFAAAWVAGISAGGQTFRRAGPRGAVAQNHLVGQYITTRTLKHRGKRHRTGVPQNTPGYRWYYAPVPPLSID